MQDIFETPNKTPKMLIADDDPAIVRLLADRCVKLGFKIETAANGLQLLIKARRNHPDIIIVDVNMPELDGLQALEKLRAIDPDCAVIMLTSLTTRQVIERAASLGAVNYIRKDTPKEEILATLRQILDTMFETGDETTNP